MLDVFDALMDELKIKQRPPFFSIPGNHDYYSGGAGFFNIIDRVNASLPHPANKGQLFLSAHPQTTPGNFSAWTPASTTAIRSITWRRR